MAFNSFYALYLTVVCIVLLWMAADKVKRYISILFVCFPFIDFAIPPGALGIRMFDVLTFFILPSWLKSPYYEGLRIPAKFWNYFMAALALLALSSLLSLTPALSLLRLWQQANYVVLFLVFISFITGPEHFFFLKKLVIWTFAGCLFFLAMQVMTGVQFNLYGRLNPNVQDLFGLRYPGPFQDPQKFAQYLSMSLFLLLGFTTERSHFLFWLAAGVVCIGLTGARASLFGLAFGLAFVHIKRAILSGRYLRSVIVLLAGCALFFAAQQLIVFQRVKSTEEDLLFRYAIWEKAFGFFLEDPVLGIGPGAYQEFVEQRDPEQVWKVEDKLVYFDHPESGLLLWLVEYGIMVFGVILLALATVVNPFTGNHRGPGAAHLTVYLEAGLLCWVISFVTVYSLSDRRIGVMVVLLASLLYHFKYVYGISFHAKPRLA
jgi:O-antigen ligase